MSKTAGSHPPPDEFEELIARLGSLRATVAEEVDLLEDLVARLPRTERQRSRPRRRPTSQPRSPAPGPPPALRVAAAEIEAAVRPTGSTRSNDFALVDPTDSRATREKFASPARGPSTLSSFNLTRRAYNSGSSSSAAAAAAQSPSERMRITSSLGRQQTMSSKFEGFFALAIVLSGAVSGVEVQWKANHLGQEVPVAFAVVRNAFSVLFLLEILLRVRTMGAQRFFCAPEERTWAFLDCVVVIGGILELFMDVVIHYHFLASSSGASSERLAGSGVFRNVRLLRIVRITRAFRLQRIIRFVSALKTLVYSIAVTLKSLMWAMVLLLIIVYVFGLAFTMEAIDVMESLAAKGEQTPDVVAYSWGSLDRSMFTLYQSISGGVSWGDPLKPLQDSSVVPAFLFTTYVAFTYFAVLNVVTGVFCSSALETTNRNPDLVAKSLLDRREESSKMLRNLFGAIDDDESGVITTDELEIIANDDMVRAYFQALDIDFRDAFTLFKLIDTKKTGSVKMEDFLMGCEQLRGGATSVHIAEVAFEVKKLSRHVSFLTERLQ